MEKVLEAIYTKGILTPLEPLDLLEEQRVTITIKIAEIEQSEDILLAWQQVYSGFSEDELTEIEDIALDRRHFMAPG